MNERIMELLKQAVYRHPRHLAVAVPEIVLRQDALEKFAELIIKECIEVASKQKNPHTLNYKPSERFVEDLKLHFGVEE